MTSIRLIVAAVSAVLLGFAGGSLSEEIQLSDDNDSLPTEQDSSNIETEEESMDKPRTQGEPGEPIQTPDSFEPSETISEDIAIPFPVDI